jgi:hypothetical protein
MEKYMVWSKIRRSVIPALALTLAPSVALAVNVSSNDGSGVQYRTSSITSGVSRGAVVSGTLKSTSGSPVYYQGLVAFAGCPDEGIGRYTSDTTSTSSVTRGGTISTTLVCGDFQGVKSKVCKNINNLPDACGSYSSTY